MNSLTLLILSLVVLFFFPPGALPDKGDLFLDPAMDQELEKL